MTEILTLLAKYQPIIIAVGTIAFSGWAYAVVWATKYIGKKIDLLSNRLEGVTYTIHYQSNRITKIEGHLETTSSFTPYRNGDR